MSSLFKRVSAFAEALNFYACNNLISKIPLHWLRNWYVRHGLGISLGRGSAIHMRCFFTGSNISIGQYTIVNRKCYLDGRGNLSIGNNVSISPEVYIVTASHDVNDTNFKAVLKSVVIEDYVWIGSRAIILPGVTLTTGSVVGAGAVVTKTTAPFTIVAGNPAKKVGERSRELTYSLRYFPWFDTDVGH